jgi:hypothetical protein
MADDDPVSPNGGSRPVPDPTVLTSRAVDALRKELTEVFDTKMDGLARLTEERFRAVYDKLLTGESLRIEQKVDTKVGLDAALAAQKEGATQQAAAFAAETAKTERNFTEQLKGQRDTFGTAIAAQTTRYDDLDKRLTRMESAKIGAGESTAERRNASQAMYALVGFVVTLVLAALVIAPIVIATRK